MEKLKALFSLDPMSNEFIEKGYRAYREGLPSLSRRVTELVEKGYRACREGLPSLSRRVTELVEVSLHLLRLSGKHIHQRTGSIFIVYFFQTDVNIIALDVEVAS